MPVYRRFAPSPMPVFTSFHYDRDHWRCQQVRNMGVVSGQQLLEPSAWEEVRRQGSAAIQRWIDSELKNCDVLLVLIGAETAQRPWVQYEIDRALTLGKGVLGVRVHRLKDQDQRQDPAGADPFTAVRGHWRRPYLPLHEAPFHDSQRVYDYIQRNLPGWLAAACGAAA